jgi:altronate dehydratase
MVRTGYDMESLAGLVSAGCQVIPVNSWPRDPCRLPCGPVVKVASTSRLFSSMEDDMDVNAGVVLEGRSLEECGRGHDFPDAGCHERRPTKAEINDILRLVCLYTLTPSF